MTHLRMDAAANKAAPDLLSQATAFTIEADAWCQAVDEFEARIDAAIEAVDRALVEVGR